MAMGRAVICTRTQGQTDVIVDGETGIYVPPHDPAALRSAIEHLLAHPDEAARMGRAGRQRVEELMTLEVYVRGLSRWVAIDRG
jgi:glycosyltransferase involved in cell wall biosynthesis